MFHPYRFCLIALCAVSLLPAQAPGQKAAPVKLLDTISLPQVKGRFDHFGVDLKHNRLFATAEDQHAVLVFDLAAAKQVTEIHGIGKPHAVLYRDDLDRI